MPRLSRCVTSTAKIGCDFAISAAWFRLTPRANLLQHMDTSTEFMGEALSNGKKVLVHCMAGVSRSATVVAAYIIKSEGLNPEEAVALVKEKRGCAEPNSGFVRQLSAWHTMGNKVDKEHALYKDLFSETPSVKKAASLGSGLSKPVTPDPDLRELSSSTAEANPVLVPEPTHTNRPEPTQETKVGSSREQQQGGPTSKACCCIS
uniref:protein-tyrosine-phosphatase n=1 Tax=Tetraselmis chuii TaxID=63592 RepID=A0A7S1SGA9_9CHLO|mmetsp:Transcript_10273/g.18556  ORF Transcript_10273/g.18556 Transcript_10273/m.18556 type:complete len:205 (+) Transcript_10273:427-1041(+)